MSSQSRRDIQTAVLFLATRSKQPDKDDLSNLVRVLNYFKVTRGLRLTLCVDQFYIVKWWVDASYAL